VLATVLFDCLLVPAGNNKIINYNNRLLLISRFLHRHEILLITLDYIWQRSEESKAIGSFVGLELPQALSFTA
jgi:hypothetical protein